MSTSFSLNWLAIVRLTKLSYLDLPARKKCFFELLRLSEFVLKFLDPKKSKTTPRFINIDSTQ